MAQRKLSELADWQLSDKDQDIRGRELYERGGNRIGKVDEMLVDTDAEVVRTIVLDNGERFSADNIDIESDGVYLKQDRMQRPKVKTYRHGEDTSKTTGGITGGQPRGMPGSSTGGSTGGNRPRA